MLTASFDGNVLVWQMEEGEFKVIMSLPLSDEVNKINLQEPEKFTTLLYHETSLIAGTISGRFVVWKLDFENNILRLVNVVKAHESVSKDNGRVSPV